MAYPTGRGEQIPSAIFRGVMEHARRMGYPVASDDLFLLAIAELAEGTPSREVLESVGIKAERLATEISSIARPMPAESDGLLFPPAFNSMAGRAEAFAASLGDGPISPEHVLMALIWDPSSQASQLLWRLGVSREDIIERLRSRGVTVPRASIPPQVEVERGEKIWIDRDDVQHLIAELPKRLPPDAHFGFNYEGDRAWVVAGASIDLRSLVHSILAS
jgi:ATP-dependent Clp protease ATP-binding subunit ClpA